MNFSMINLVSPSLVEFISAAILTYVLIEGRVVKAGSAFAVDRDEGILIGVQVRGLDENAFTL